VISANEFRAVGSNQVFYQLCCVSRCVQARRRHVVCFVENGRLHFIHDNAKVIAKLYVETL